MHLSLSKDPKTAGTELGEFIHHAARQVELANRHNKHAFRQVMALAMTHMTGALIQDIGLDGLDVLFANLKIAAQEVVIAANDEDKKP